MDPSEPGPGNPGSRGSPGKWSRPMVAGFVLVLIGAVGALLAWFVWSSPGNVSGLFDINLGDLTPGFALRFGAVPGSQSGLASSRGSLGVVVAVVLIAVAVATWYTKDRRNVLVGCECGLVVGALGLVVNAYEALHETLNATKAIDDGLDRLLTATAALRSLPVLGTISDTITSEVHHARRHVVSHSVVPAVIGLIGGGVALIGSVVLLTGTLRRKAAPVDP